jgi:MFS family permease
MQRQWILPVIVIAQFFCTSIWFAGNAVMKELINNFHLPVTALGHLTSAVQLGFITGTLCYALLMIADRFPPAVVFFISAVAGAAANIAVIINGQTLSSMLLLRFLAGFFLAGIYPVGMKIAADHYDKGLGKALGYLVGALVIGTAFPHLLRSITMAMPWKFVLILTSILCIAGGALMVILVPNGPYRKRSEQPDIKVLYKIFRNKKFRSASFGYFGHMWELYTWWAFVPVILSGYKNSHENNLNIPLLSFIIIAVGGVACIAGGYLSQKYGAKKIAAVALSISGLCCIASPYLFSIPSKGLLLLFLVCWGMAVVADSPMFSTLVAQNAPAASKGSALTIVTCIGFSITIVSIQLLTYFNQVMDPKYLYLLLAPGPLLGIAALLTPSTQKTKTQQL